MANITEKILYHFVDGYDPSGESTYDIWKSAGYTGGAAEFLDFMRSASVDGVLIKSIEQTKASDEDGGDNIITVTLTDGTVSTFTIKNGTGSGSTDASSQIAEHNESDTAHYDIRLALNALEDNQTIVDYDETREMLTIKQKSLLENGEVACIDKSLTVEGAVAEAKATGDAIAELSENLDQKIGTHVENYNNPHKVSPTQIGAATAEDLDVIKKNVNALINDPYKILRDLAIVSTGGVEITDLSLYETNYGFINTSNVWANINEKYQYVIIPITSTGAKLQVTALSNTVFYFAGLRSFDSTPSVNDVPDFSTAEGWTGRKTGSMGNTHSFQIPDDVKYLYINVVYNNTPAYTPYFNLTIPESDGRINILEKKVEALEQGAVVQEEKIKWIALGDSITEGYYSIYGENVEDVENHKDVSKSYCVWAAKQKGFELTNKGVGGSGWLKRGTTSAPKLNAREQIDAVNEDGSYVLDFTQFDLCTIMWGVNDWKGKELLGSFEDGLNPATESVISNMRYVIETILTRNPEIKLIILTPINCRRDTSARISTAENNWGIGFTFGDGDNKKTLQDYYDAIKQVCEYYGIEMIDMLHNSVINRINAETLLPDKVHPSLEAHRKMGLELAGKILFGN